MLATSLKGRLRAVPILGLIQILGWGSTYYAPALVAPQIAAEKGWSLTFSISGLTIGMAVGGLCSPLSTRLVQKWGGHIAIAGGALIAAAGLVALTIVDRQLTFVLAWIWLGLAMSLVLSDPSYVAMSQIFPGQARRPMVFISLIAGLAGSISWALTYLLMQLGSWRTPLLFYAAAFAFVAAPLLVFVLPRPARGSQTQSVIAVGEAEAISAPSGRPLWTQFAGFAAYAFTISAILAHFIPMIERGGIQASTAVGIAMLLGPMQLAVRFFELLAKRRPHPLFMTRFAVMTFAAAFAMLLIFGISILTAVVFAVLMGVANGVMTIARGVLPLAIFGQEGYPKAAGILAAANLGAQALGPLVLAIVIERASDAAAVGLLGAVAALSILSFFALRRAGPRSLPPAKP